MSFEYTAEWKKRMCYRLAQILKDHHDFGSGGGHTRIIEFLLVDEAIIVGESVNGKTYREHVVPLCVIRDESMRMYKEGKDVDEVAEAINNHLAIILISNEEADILNKVKGWKTKMPDGWRFNQGDIFARLTEANIKFSLK